MKYFLNFIVIIVYLFFYNLSYSDSGLAYINMEILMNKSKAGQSISVELEKEKEKNFKELKHIEKELKKEEDEIVSQKNILKKEDYEKKISELRNKFKSYQEKKNSKNKELNLLRNSLGNKILKNINEIMTEYSKNNSISLVIQKQSIIIGKTELDVTNDILKLLNKKITKIDLD